jgi:hypothetical protein
LTFGRPGFFRLILIAAMGWAKDEENEEHGTWSAMTRIY